MSEHFIHAGSTADPRHCAECGIEILDLTATGKSSAIAADMHFQPLPVYVGGWQMGQFRFNLTKRPRWLTRVMMKWLLEWEWRDV